MNKQNIPNACGTNTSGSAAGTPAHFAPGKWRIDTDLSDGRTAFVVSDNGFIAKVMLDNNHERHSAFLIVNAPEMYNLLQEVLDLITEEGSEFNYQESGEIQQLVFDIDSVLRRARGELASV